MVQEAGMNVMSMNSPVQMTAVMVAAAVQSGDLTVVEVAEAVIERYEQRNHDVQAFAYFNREQVRAAAKELDAAAEKGPLHGVPIALKDVINWVSPPSVETSS